MWGFAAVPLFAEELPLIPYPQQVVTGEGSFNWSTTDQYVFEITHEVFADPISHNAIELMCLTLDEQGFQYTVDTLLDKARQNYELIFRRQGVENSGNTQSKYQTSAEGYWLRVLPNQILAKGADPAGLLYAVQSFRQLIQSLGAIQGLLPCCTIIDYPSFSFRGIMDDISRGPLPNLEFMKTQIERCAYYKINVFGFYIEHVLRTPRHNAYAPDDGLTLDELNELQQYASKFNVSLLGSFQSFGHFRNILQHPEYQGLGVSDRTLYPGDSNALNFLFEVYESIYPVFDHPIFNINGDEVYDLARGPLHELAKREGEASIFLSHIQPLLTKVGNLGKRPGMWGDMLVKYPQLLADIPSETVVFCWDYDADGDFHHWTDPVVAAGLEFIACPGIVNSYALWPDLEKSELNIRRFVNHAFAEGALGIYTTIWDDGGRHFFHSDWYGVAVAGAYSWAPDSLSQAKTRDHYGMIHFQDTSRLFGELLSELSGMKNIPRLARLNNYLLNTAFGSSSSSIEQIDTSGFVMIQKASERLQKILLQLNKSDISEASKRELAIWKLKVQTLSANVETASSFLNLAQEPEPKLMIRNAIHHWQILRDSFSKFWFEENRAYWYDKAIKLYGEKISALTEILQSQDLHVRSTVSRFAATSSFSMCYFLGAGPFKGGFEVDYLLENEDETGIQPAAIDYFRNQSGEDQGWQKIISTRSGEFCLADFYPVDGRDSIIVYTVAHIDLDQDMMIPIDVTSRAPLKMFFNGEELKAGLGQREHLVLPGKEGKNYLLLKMQYQNSDDSCFSLQLNENISVRQNKYKYRLN